MINYWILNKEFLDENLPKEYSLLRVVRNLFFLTSQEGINKKLSVFVEKLRFWYPFASTRFGYFWVILIKLYYTFKTIGDLSSPFAVGIKVE